MRRRNWTPDLAQQAIAAVAVAWWRARREERQLRKDRDAAYCERAEPIVAASEAAELAAPRGQEAPCWKPSGHDEEGEPRYRPREEWCPTCRRRQWAHESLRRTTRYRAALERRLLARARTLEGLEAALSGREESRG